jgi:monofunctional biosynthetic peptidoglycan transglycosylase
MARAKPARRSHWIRRLLLISLAIGVLAVLYLALSWPDVASLERENPKTTAFIDAAKERGIKIEWRWAPYDQISDDLKKAVLVAEDYSFFSHNGFDTHEIKAAAREAVQGKRVRGASTITQQLAKNLWLSPSRSPTRKLREIALTRQLEQGLSKQRILELYLNVVEFGPGVFGAEAGARRYFSVPAADLDAVQAAQLAASLPRPSSWHPGVSSHGYERSVDRILILLEQADWLDKWL